MDYAEFKRQVHKAGITLHAFSRLMGLNVSTISGYSGGEVPQHLALIATLLALCVDAGIDPWPHIQDIKPPIRRPRGRSFARKKGAE